MWRGDIDTLGWIIESPFEVCTERKERKRRNLWESESAFAIRKIYELYKSCMRINHNNNIQFVWMKFMKCTRRTERVREEFNEMHVIQKHTHTCLSLSLCRCIHEWKITAEMNINVPEWEINKNLERKRDELTDFRWICVDDTLDLSILVLRHPVDSRLLRGACWSICWIGNLIFFFHSFIRV